MQIHVSVSIFASPVSAWGQATGEIEVPHKPGNASDVILPQLPKELLAAPVEVESVWEESGLGTIVSLNVLAKDAAAARDVGSWLAREWGLFADAYWEE